MHAQLAAAQPFQRTDAGDVAGTKRAGDEIFLAPDKIPSEARRHVFLSRTRARQGRSLRICPALHCMGLQIALQRYTAAKLLNSSLYTTWILIAVAVGEEVPYD